MKIAFTFPGQGSQKVGMGADLAEKFNSARELFDEIDEALGYRLTNIMWQGPEEKLTLTENAQPALMAVSMAVMRVLNKEFGFSLQDNVTFVAGHSLGEYAALAASGAIRVSDTARLLRTRGQAMQAAVPVGEGAMAALLGVEIDQARELAEASAEGDVCQAANDNAPGQVVLSGSKAAIERAIALASDFGARRAVPLPVSAPFHCALMKPAAEVMASALESVDIIIPGVPLICNTLAAPVTDPQEIRKQLVEQVTGLVRWRESVQYMADHGITDIYEIGTGRVLTGLARRIHREFNAHSIGSPDDFQTVIDESKLSP